jgi:antitoxin-like ribbon-helix-helix protein
MPRTPKADEPRLRPEGESPPSGRSKALPDGRKGILVRARPEAWKALKLIALDREMTLQDLMTEAINDALAKHGKPPVA